MPRSHLNNVLHERVTNVVDKTAAELMAGSAIHDPGLYRDQVGYVRGLLDALKIADEIEQDSEKS